LGEIGMSGIVRNGLFRTVACALLLTSAATPAAAEIAIANKASDEEQIFAHIHHIFQAFIDQDRATIAATHSEDWTGFQVSATGITRGLDGYMANVGFRNPMQRYEIEDIEVKVYGDTAVVYYTARWWSYITALEQYLTQHARSVDIYQRRNGEWIQIGSNISLIPRPRASQNDAYTEIFDADLLDEMPPAKN